MAKKVQVTLIDDIDGGSAIETVGFAIDGSSYEIDLSKANAKKLRDSLSTYVAHARKGGRVRSSSRSGRATARTDREQVQAIREWARRNGHKVSDRGRVPASVIDAYNAAN
ncbi:MAG TPA: Lsr2 family protein [Mycobacterium sp.]|nr:Lsr2 family protein [Mycobacterium sp.]